MKSMQRNMGKLMKRSENEADVTAVISDFKAVDNMLERLVKDIKAWRDAWEEVLKFQYDASEAFVNLYKPIEATGDASTRRHVDEVTPNNYMQKALGLQKEYGDEKTDLAQEISLITNKLLFPAEEAKQRTKLLQKTLKHRENMKLDYERYTGRVDHARKKEQRSPKDEQNLQIQEASLAQSKIDYQTADEHVKQTFPPVTSAILSLLPYLLEYAVRLQCTLVGQLYTVLDAYTRQYGLPNPAPPDTEIVRAWDGEFTSLRKELESGLSLVAKGRVVHMNMNLPPEKEKGTVTGMGIRNKVMHKKETKPTGMPSRPSPRSSTGAIEAPTDEYGYEEPAPLKPPRPPASPGLSPARSPGPPPPPPGPPAINMTIKPRMSSAPSTLQRLTSAPATMQQSNGFPPSAAPPPYDYKPTALTPGYPNHQATWEGAATPPSRYLTPANGGASPLMPTLSPQQSNTSDYFSQNTNTGARRPSAHSLATSTSQASLASAAAAAAAKKKPPPPVPAKRMPSFQAQYVTALYDFVGQAQGDLSFREGERIKVVKKTESTDDWWEGELNGVLGSFPANYVQV